MKIIPILFSFQGRIRRTTYWLAGIGSGLVLGLVYIVFAVATGALAKGPGGLWAPQFLPIEAVGLWVSLAIAAKRCHDRGYPAVMVLILFVPFIGGLWGLIDLGFIGGTPGENKYGPSPKAPLLRAAAAA